MPFGIEKVEMFPDCAHTDRVHKNMKLFPDRAYKNIETPPDIVYKNMIRVNLIIR